MSLIKKIHVEGLLRQGKDKGNGLITSPYRECTTRSEDFNEVKHASNLRTRGKTWTPIYILLYEGLTWNFFNILGIFQDKKIT